MLPVAHRLRRPDQFRTVPRRGRRAGRPTLVLHLVTGDVGDAQVGFVVSTAVGNAVVRNRVRRRLQHAVAQRWSRLVPGDQVVVRALPPAADATYAALGEDLQVALDRLSRPALVVGAS